MAAARSDVMPSDLQIVACVYTSLCNLTYRKLAYGQASHSHYYDGDYNMHQDSFAYTEIVVVLQYKEHLGSNTSA